MVSLCLTAIDSNLPVFRWVESIPNWWMEWGWWMKCVYKYISYHNLRLRWFNLVSRMKISTEKYDVANQHKHVHVVRGICNVSICLITVQISTFVLCVFRVSAWFRLIKYLHTDDLRPPWTALNVYLVCRRLNIIKYTPWRFISCHILFLLLQEISIETSESTSNLGYHQFPSCHLHQKIRKFVWRLPTHIQRAFPWSRWIHFSPSSEILSVEAPKSLLQQRWFWFRFYKFLYFIHFHS